MKGTNLNSKEKLFVGVAWMPKATVQAALGGVVLGLAENEDLGSDYETWGLQILTIAFLCIVITAPIGAILTAFLGPRLLEKEDPPLDQLDEHIMSHRWVAVRKRLSLDKIMPALQEICVSAKFQRSNSGALQNEVEKAFNAVEEQNGDPTPDLARKVSEPIINIRKESMEVTQEDKYKASIRHINQSFNGNDETTLLEQDATGNS
jgi:hypothetical protein